MRYFIASVATVALLLSACSDDTTAGRATRTTQKATTSAGTSTPVAGSPAVWLIGDPGAVSARSTRFTADVMGLECSGGVTGKVLAPTIREDSARVVVTFSVEEPGPGGHTCPSNNPVPTIVQLKDPMGRRQLVDGACDLDGAAVSTAYCEAEYDPVRWSP